MNDLSSAADFLQWPVILGFITMIATRVWKSREVVALREMIKNIEDELFNEQRRHNATKRRVKMLQDELDEYRPVNEEEKEEGASGQEDG